MQKNAIRSLREYVDTIISKRPSDSSKGVGLSSGSESTLGGVETDQQQLSGPRPVRQLSNAAEIGQPEGGGGGGEGGDRTQGSPSVTTNGSHASHAPDTRVGVSTSTPHHPAGAGVGGNRTQSESGGVGGAVSQSQGDVPLKSLTAPTIGGSVSDGEERRSSMSSKTKPANLAKVVTAVQASTDPSKVQTGVSALVPGGQQEQRLGESLAAGNSGHGQLMEDNSTSSSLLSADTAASSHGGGGGTTGLEANSSSSLTQDMFPSGSGTGATTGDSKPTYAEKASADKPPSGQPGTNGKKKLVRSKQRQLKLDLKELEGHVVKCTLNTSSGQVDFRFSMKYDKPSVLFRNLVSLNYCSVFFFSTHLEHCRL